MSKSRGGSGVGKLPKSDPSLTELYERKYDTTLDLYQRVAHAQMVATYRDYYDSGGAGTLAHPDLEYYLYKVFGSDIIGSIAFALDPYWQVIKVPKGKFYDKYRKVLASEHAVTIVPANRTRTRTSVFEQSLTFHEGSHTVTHQNGLHWDGSGFSLIDLPDITGQTSYTYSPGVQRALYGTISDTTWKTRNPNNGKIGSKSIKQKGLLQSQGEMESFDLTVPATPFHWGYDNNHNYQNESAIGSNKWLFDKGGSKYFGYTGNCARLDTTVVPLIKQALTDRANAIMADNCDAMFARCVPQRRYYNLAYQVSELKDIPGLLRSTLSQWYKFQNAIGGANQFRKILTSPSWWTEKNVNSIRQPLMALGLNSHLGKDLADLYLSFKFGWQSIVQAVEKLLKSPISAANDVNRLIARNGRFSNLSSTKSWVEDYPSPPAMTVGSWQHFLSDDLDDPTSASAKLSVNVRCMANVGINFPNVDVPNFRWNLFWQKMGAVPTPGDMYDIIPFTWMVDWFAGLGDYIHLMDATNGDQSLVNYAFMTVKLRLETTTTCGFKAHALDSYRIIPPDNVSTPIHYSRDEWLKWKVSPKYYADYEVRKSLADVMNVKYTSGYGLSDYQKNVLGALFQKFT